MKLWNILQAKINVCRVAHIYDEFIILIVT